MSSSNFVPVPPGVQSGGIVLPANWQEEFITAFREKFNLAWAAKIAGVSRPTIYKYLKEDHLFREAFENAKEDAIDALEGSLYQRAKDGVKQVRRFYDPKTNALVSEQIRTEYSDTGAIKILEARRPDPYRPSQEIKHSGYLSIEERQENRRQKLTEAVQRGLDRGWTLAATLEYLILRGVPKEHLALVKGEDLQLPEEAESIDIEAQEIHTNGSDASGNGHKL